ncbi:putative membrane protein [Escherichia coli 1-176-05_S3_C2]|nr:putative membrane protein [Escherichia coli 1-176-05_S3_C2]
MNKSNSLDYFTLYIIFSIAFMLISILIILIAKPSIWLGEVLVTINLINALVWLVINLLNRLREKLVSQRDQHYPFF